MPNSWDFNILIEETFNRDLLAQILAVVEQNRYLLKYDNGITVYNHDQKKIQNQSSFYDYICTNGGLFLVWKEEESIALNWEPQTKYFSLSVSHDLRFDRQADRDMAHDLTIIFENLCRSLNVRYGYSSDEWVVEDTLTYENFMDSWELFNNSIYSCQTPHILFWKNYFSKEYFVQCVKSKIIQLQYFLKEVGDKGVLISLCNDPWDATLVLLDENGEYVH